MRPLPRPRRASLLALVVVMVALAAPAAALTSGSYDGRTSQRHSISIALRRHEIKRLAIVWTAHCRATHTELASVTTYQRHIKLGRHGWRTQGRYEAPEVQGYLEKFAIRDRGRFVGKNTLRGSFSGTVEVFNASTSQYV